MEKLRPLSIAISLASLLVIPACKQRASEIRSDEGSFGGFTDEERRLFDEIAPKCTFLNIAQVVTKHSELLQWIKLDELQLLSKKFADLEEPAPWNSDPIIERRTAENGAEEVTQKEFSVQLDLANKLSTGAQVDPRVDTNASIPIQVYMDHLTTIRASAVVRNFLAQARTKFYEGLKVRPIKTKNGMILAFNLGHHPSDDDPVQVNAASQHVVQETDEDPEEELAATEGEPEGQPSLGEVAMIQPSSAMGHSESFMQKNDDGTEVLTHKPITALEALVGVARTTLRKSLYTVNPHFTTESKLTGFWNGTYPILRTGDVFTIDDEVLGFDRQDGGKERLGFSLVGSGFGIYVGDPVSMDATEYNDIFVFGKVADERSIQSLALLRKAFQGVPVTPERPVETVITKVSDPSSYNNRNPANVECFKTNGHLQCKDSVYRFGLIPIHGGIEIKRLDGQFSTNTESIATPKNIEGTNCCRPIVTEEVIRDSASLLRTFRQRLAQNKNNLISAYNEFSMFGTVGLMNYEVSKDSAGNEDDAASYLTRSQLAEYLVLTEKYYDNANIHNPSHLRRFGQILEVLEQNDQQKSAAYRELMELASNAEPILANLRIAHAIALGWFSFPGHAKDWPTFEEEGGYDGQQLIQQPVSEIFLTLQTKMGNTARARVANRGMYDTMLAAVEGNRLAILKEYKAGGRNPTSRWGLRPGIDHWFTTKEYRQALRLLIPDRPVPVLTTGFTTLLSSNPFGRVYTLPKFKDRAEAGRTFKPIYDYLNDPKVKLTLFFAFDDMRIEAKATGRQDPFEVRNPTTGPRSRNKPPPKALPPDIGASRRWRAERVRLALQQETAAMAQLGNLLVALEGRLAALLDGESE